MGVAVEKAVAMGIWIVMGIIVKLSRTKIDFQCKNDF